MESKGDNAGTVSSAQLFPLGFSLDLGHRDLNENQKNSIRNWDSPYEIFFFFFFKFWTLP